MTVPIIVAGPATVTLSSSHVGEFVIIDLPGKLYMSPGQSVDLGALYTQLQILSSVDLKRQLLNGTLVLTLVGTTPE